MPRNPSEARVSGQGQRHFDRRLPWLGFPLGLGFPLDSTVGSGVESTRVDSIVYGLFFRSLSLYQDVVSATFLRSVGFGLPIQPADLDLVHA